MHYHLEVVMPPVSDPKQALESILAPFSEHSDECRPKFWDWWVIGGRWSGVKQEATFPASKIEEFKQWLTEEGMTVSGVQVGKPELSPAGQIDKVDAKWQAMFGVTGSCTLFRHSNARQEVLEGDVCTLGDVANVAAHRVIIAGPGYEGGVEACYMIEQEYWNGVTYVQTTWNGELRSALAMWQKKSADYTESWRESHTPQSDWLVVTVDYHS